MTNIGTFRAYLNEYLRNHPRIRKDMTLMAVSYTHLTMTATRAYFVSMFILPPCEEGTTIQSVWFGVAAPGMIEISSWGDVYKRQSG